MKNLLRSVKPPAYFSKNVFLKLFNPQKNLFYRKNLIYIQRLPILLGRRQVASLEVLVLAFGGSNPSAPAKFLLDIVLHFWMNPGN